MILSFQHEGLETFSRTGSKKGIQAQHAARLTRILTALEAATQPDDMNLPGYGLHRLEGRMKGHWSVRVSGNWRVTFRFEGPDTEQVDYTDYH